MFKKKSSIFFQLRKNQQKLWSPFRNSKPFSPNKKKYENQGWMKKSQNQLMIPS